MCVYSINFYQKTKDKTKDDKIFLMLTHFCILDIYDLFYVYYLHYTHDFLRGMLSTVCFFCFFLWGYDTIICFIDAIKIVLNRDLCSGGS